MPPIELGPTRPVGAIDARIARAAGGAPERPAKAEKAPAAIVHSDALGAGDAPPVDAERVKVIRHAVETGTYPLIPAKVADAMIAAGLLLRSAR